VPIVHLQRSEIFTCASIAQSGISFAYSPMEMRFASNSTKNTTHEQSLCFFSMLFLNKNTHSHARGFLAGSTLTGAPDLKCVYSYCVFLDRSNQKRPNRLWQKILTTKIKQLKS